MSGRKKSQKKKMKMVLASSVTLVPNVGPGSGETEKGAGPESPEGAGQGMMTGTPRWFLLGWPWRRLAVGQPPGQAQRSPGGQISGYQVSGSHHGRHPDPASGPAQQGAR